ncbi:MAG: Recombinase [Actinomycetota bacterium]|nr:Recombinase [Actinomycetota bacterium]
MLDSVNEGLRDNGGVDNEYAAGGHSTREITRRLNADGIPTPTGGKAVWGTSTIGRLLRNEAYVGRVY